MKTGRRYNRSIQQFPTCSQKLISNTVSVMVVANALANCPSDKRNIWESKRVRAHSQKSIHVHAREPQRKNAISNFKIRRAINLFHITSQYQNCLSRLIVKMNANNMHPAYRYRPSQKCRRILLYAKFTQWHVSPTFSRPKSSKLFLSQLF